MNRKEILEAAQKCVCGDRKQDYGSVVEHNKNSLEIVQEHLDQEEILTHLAEEASELAKAALKLRRAYMKINPTPVSASKAYENLLEEIADVSNCITALGFDRAIDRMTVSRIAADKMNRWAERLEAACDG